MSLEMATVVSVKHPTGMHSCFIIAINIIGDIARILPF